MFEARGGKRTHHAKRTQFPLDGPGERGRSPHWGSTMRNKANFCQTDREGPEPARSGRQPRWIKRAKQSQFSRTDRNGKGAVMPSGLAVAEVDHAKRTQFPLDGPGGRGGSLPSESTMRNKANFPRMGMSEGLRGRPCRRLRNRLRQTKPISPGQGGRSGGQLCKTNPIVLGCPAMGAGWHGLESPLRIDCAKQSQFARTGVDVPGPTGGSAPASSVRNKPNFAAEVQSGEVGRVPSTTVTEPDFAKQDAHDKSPQVGFRPAFLGRYRGLVRLFPTFVGRVKQSQFRQSASKEVFLDNRVMTYFALVRVLKKQSQFPGPARHTGSGIRLPMPTRPELYEQRTNS